MSEAIGNVVIEQLRGKYLEVSKRYAEIVAKLGKDHMAAASFRSEMNEYERLMFDELIRLAESYLSELEIAKSREESLTDELKKTVALNAAENKSLVTLRELEREGETYRNLYKDYLQRYNEALQQQSFPIIEARIITSASPPAAPSHPKKLPILLLFGLIGGSAGAGIGLLREFREKGFRSEWQIRSQLGLEYLGVLPKITQLAEGTRAESSEAAPAEAADEELLKSGRPNPRFIPASFGIMSYSLLRPGSGFVETLLAAKLAADVKLAETHSKVIGTVSVLPGEGKSAFSKNLASLLAQIGHKTLLIDADLRIAKLTKQVAPTASQGLLEGVIYKVPLQDLVMVERSSGLSFLPCVVPPRMSHTSAFLASTALKHFLVEAQEQFDYIVLDLPPLGPVVDARAVAPEIHAFVFVVEWRKTPRNMVRSVLANSPQIYNKCLGVILNKVNVNELRLYEEPGSHFRHFAEYENTYYREGRHDRARAPGLIRRCFNTSRKKRTE